MFHKSNPNHEYPVQDIVRSSLPAGHAPYLWPGVMVKFFNFGKIEPDF
jgi:hypothetical protein